MKILECSSAGDKRFSAFYTMVDMFGVTESIESHYQAVKRNAKGNYCRKGEKVDHIIIKGHKLDVKYLTPLYILLWVKYLDKHPELVAFASQFDDFNDKFRGKCVNCQADVIRVYVKYGRKMLVNTHPVKEFMEVLREINKVTA